MEFKERNLQFISIKGLEEKMEFTYYIGAMLIHLVTFSGSFEMPSPEKVYPDYIT